MIGAYASVAVVCVASVVVGQAILALAGRRHRNWLAGGVGLAALLVVAGIAVKLPGHGTAVAVALAATLVVSAAFLLVRRPPSAATTGRAGNRRVGGLVAAGLALLGASLPFIAAGKIGILGVGLVNDDMANHLLVTSWLDERFSPEPVLVDQGYPLGPHALVAGLSKTVGGNPIDAFAGLTLAIPALTALVAYAALDGLGRVARPLAAAATALPYLVAAYLAQEAFKEPIMALLLLTFALLLPRVRDARGAVPLGVVAAGAVYAYSFPGLFWLAGTAVIWALAELAARRFGRRPRNASSVDERQRSPGRAPVGALAAAAVVAFVLVLPEIGRLLDFADFRALDPDRANEGGLGNLRGHLSPLEAFGVWPTSEFRLSAGAGSLPAVVFYAGAALGLLALALGLPRWTRRNGWAIPAALATAAALYLVARGWGTVYTSAKALAIGSPLILLIALGGVLRGRGGAPSGSPASPTEAHAPPVSAKVRPIAHPLSLIAVVLMIGVAVSSFLVLRQAPVGPEDHMEELAEIRPIVEGEKLLFLGRDNFVLWELRGSKPFTHVRNFYDPYFVRPNFEIANVGFKFDFDSVEAEKLARFPYVLTTRASYASGPPPHYTAAHESDSYVLWRQEASPAGREPVERDPQPTAELKCGSGRLARAARAAFAAQAPERIDAAGWSPSTTIEDGAPATISLDLPPGEWELSLQYDSTRPINLTGPGLEAELPGNLDYRGATPYWPAGRIGSDGRPVAIEASVERPPLAGRVMGANAVAHLGAIGATATGPPYQAGLPAPHPGLGERHAPARIVCGREADWLSRSP